MNNWKYHHVLSDIQVSKGYMFKLRSGRVGTFADLVNSEDNPEWTKQDAEDLNKIVEYLRNLPIGASLHK